MALYSETKPAVVILKDYSRLPVVAKYVAFLAVDDVYMLVATQEVAHGDVVTQLYHTPPVDMSENHIPLTVTGLLHRYQVEDVFSDIFRTDKVVDKRFFAKVEPYVSFFGLHQFFSDRASHEIDDEKPLSALIRERQRDAFYQRDQLGEFSTYEPVTTNTHLHDLVVQFVEQKQHIALTIPVSEFKSFKPTVAGWVYWHTGHATEDE
jgi:hypothetical protein